MVAQEVRDIVKKFVAELRSRGVHVDKTLLYGSFAAGTQAEDSDLDLAVVSGDFGQDRFNEGRMLMQLAWRIDPRLHPVPISTDSFLHDTWVPLIHEIREHGIEVI
jgi:predicted nucleotidyltransferase